jgi:hypothetical protein
MRFPRHALDRRRAAAPADEERETAGVEGRLGQKLQALLPPKFNSRLRMALGPEIVDLLALSEEIAVANQKGHRGVVAE